MVLCDNFFKSTFRCYLILVMQEVPSKRTMAPTEEFSQKVCDFGVNNCESVIGAHKPKLVFNMSFLENFFHFSYFVEVSHDHLHHKLKEFIDIDLFINGKRVVSKQVISKYEQTSSEVLCDFPSIHSLEIIIYEIL